MKKLLLFGILFGILLPVYSQLATTFLNINNAQAQINPYGELFYDRANFFPGLQVPANSNSYAIYYSALAVIAEDSASNDYGMHSDYSSLDNNLGPLKVDLGTTVSSIAVNFNRIWSVSAADITTHQAQWSNSSYTAPSDIINWPAHGDTTQGYDFYLAPFVDANNNGVYEPMQGDYPDINGFSALYIIYNDATTHANTGGPSMGLEIHCMMYAFPANNALNETIFVDYRIINRSAKDYFNVKIGQFADFDLGNPTDDFIETDLNRNLVYTKNGDNFDEDFAGTNGYGNLHGAIGMITLKGPKLDDDQIDNPCGIGVNYQPNGTGFFDGIPDNERYGMTNCVSYNTRSAPIGGDVTTDLDLVRYMNSRWKNNRPQTFGGDGYLASGGTPSRVPYFLNTDSTNYSTGGVSVASNWSENSASNIPGDRKVITASGPFTLRSGDEMDVTYAFVFARASTTNSVASSVANIKIAADTVINFYRRSVNLNQCSGLVGINDQQIGESETTLYPNPNRGEFSIELQESAEVTVYNLEGKLIYRKSYEAGKQFIQLSQSIDAAMYLVKIKYQGETIEKKLLVHP